MAHMQTSIRGKAIPIRVLAAGLYVASLLMIPYRTLDPNMQMRGFELLLVGWGSLPNILAWLANPLLILSLTVMPKRPAIAIVASTLALLLSIDFRDVQTLGWDSSRDAEAGQVTSIGAGAYVWLASVTFALLASLMGCIERRAIMRTPPDSPAGPFKPLFFMCLALLLTPAIVTIASLFLLSQVELTAVFTRIFGLSTSPELVVAALLAVAIGMAVYLVITALSHQRPTLADMIAIELSQAFAFSLAIAALLHNPQEEFCRADLTASALAEVFQLGNCSLTTEFWMQAGVGGLVTAVAFVVVLRLGRAATRAIFN